MAREKKSLAGFGEVASITTDSNNNNENINVNDHENNIKTPGTEDFLDDLIRGTKKKDDQLILTGIYLQKDLAQILDKLGKKGGRGTKSRIVNDALRKVFEEKGLVEHKNV